MPVQQQPEYFFLYANGTPLAANCAAFLSLSIAIKADLHFQTCLDAKILQLKESFQAKLGWLVGQLYSRVGTTDWPREKLNKEVEAVLGEAAIWVEESKISFLEGEYKKLSMGNPNTTMSQKDISTAASSAPTKKRQILDQAEKVIAEALGPDRKEDVTKLRRRLEYDAGLTSLLRK